MADIQLGKVHQRCRAVRDFDIGEEVMEFLRVIGIENLLNLAIQDRRNSWCLIHGLATRYSPQRQLFEFGIESNVKLYFGLRDILHLIGLKISGKPVIVKVDANGETIANSIFPGLGVFVKDSGICLNKLKNIATERRGDAYAHSLEIRKRSTALYLLGILIFPSSSGHFVNPLLAKFVENVDDIGNFAWGEAAVVEIHHCLEFYTKRVEEILHKKDRKSKTKKVGLGGSATALLAFAFEYIKPLSNLYTLEQFPATFPLASSWARRTNKTLKSSYPEVDLDDIEKCFRNLTNDDINWNPYESNLERMPISYQEQDKMGLAILPMFKLNLGLYNRPYVCPLQFQLSEMQSREMENWMEHEVKARNKFSLLRCELAKGPGIKDYWDVWKGILSIDVIDARNKIQRQTWLAMEQVEREVTVDQCTQMLERGDTIPSPNGHDEKRAKISEKRKVSLWPTKTLDDRPFPSPEGVERCRRKPQKQGGLVTPAKVYTRRVKVAPPQTKESPPEEESVTIVKGTGEFISPETKIQQLKESLQRKDLVKVSNLYFLEDATTEPCNEKQLSDIVYGCINGLVENWEVEVNAGYHPWMLSKKALSEFMDEDKWFSDDVMNIYMALLRTENPNFAFVDTSLLKNLIYNYPNLKLSDGQFTEASRRHFERAKQIFVPIIYKSHWHSMVFHVEHKDAFVLDTIEHDKSYYDTIKEVAACLVNKLINDQSCQWTFRLVEDTPKQVDGSTCGPLTLKIMQCWATGYKPSFIGKVDAHIARKFIIWEIIKRRPINSLMYGREIGNHLAVTPRKKLLIFDLNGVLLKSHGRHDSVYRRHNEAFLEFCSKMFVVAVWSSKKRVISTCQYLERKVKGLKFLFYWNQDKCTISQEKVLGHPQKPIMFKDLQRVWRVYQEYSASNTVLIDDSVYKTYLNPEYTSIIPLSFLEQDDYLDPQNDFAKYLEELAAAEDVQDHIKNNHFGEPDYQDSYTREYYQGAAQRSF